MKFYIQATIGIDFLSKTMYLEDRTVRLQLWVSFLLLITVMSINFGFNVRTPRAKKGSDRLFHRTLGIQLLLLSFMISLVT